MNKLILVPLMGLLLAGCGVKPPVEGRLDPYDSKQVHFASGDLRKHTAVGAPLATRDEVGRLLFVTVPIRAATDLKLYVDYRVTFFDETGQMIHQTGWMNKTLEPNVPDRIVVNSTSPRAREFQVDFRYAQ